MIISEMLKEKRNEYGLTQEQLSEKIFVSRKTISNWETDKTTPDIDSLIRLANLFNLSLDNLLLEGSDIVENIKKIESAKVARKYFLISWITNIIFLLISLTQIFFGKLSLFALVLLTIVEILNAIVLFYFTKELSATNDKTAYQIIKSERPILFIPLFLLVLLIIILFILNYIF